MVRSRWRVVLALGVVVAAASVVVGVLSSPSKGAVKGSATSRAKVSVLVVSGPLSDPFFQAWKKGADAGAKALGISYKYLAPNDFSNLAPDLARLTQSAIAQHPSAIAVGDFIPATLDPLIKKAVGKGIPVVVVNSGLTSWEKDGAIAFVGENPTLMGGEGGKRLAAAGVKNGLCVNQVPQNPTLTARCDGFVAALKKAGGKGKTLKIPYADSNNPTAVTQDIKGALSADSSIDGVFTLGAGIAEDALKMLQDSGKASKVKLGTTDLSLNVLKDIKAGTILFAMDQQPYLQGFYSVQIGAQYAQYGVHPIGVITTGPLPITKKNVDQVLAAASVRGSG